MTSKQGTTTPKTKGKSKKPPRNEIAYQETIKKKLANPWMTVRQLEKEIWVAKSSISRYIQRYLEENKDANKAIEHFNNEMMLETQVMLKQYRGQLEQKWEITTQDADVLSKISERWFKQNRLLAWESTQNISQVTQINIIDPNTDK